MMHDFAITKDHVVFILCPVVFSFENLQRRAAASSPGSPSAARASASCRAAAATPTCAGSTPTRATSSIPMNAYDEDGRDRARRRALRAARLHEPEARARPGLARRERRPLHRWRIDLRGGGVRSTPLDDVDGEFPRVDERLRRPQASLRLLARGAEATATSARAAFDGHPALRPRARHRARRATSAPATASASRSSSRATPTPPRTTATCSSLAYDQARNASDFFVLDARDIAGEPIARVIAAAPRAVRLPRQLGRRVARRLAAVRRTRLRSRRWRGGRRRAPSPRRRRA